MTHLLLSGDAARSTVCRPPRSASGRWGWFFFLSAGFCTHYALPLSAWCPRRRPAAGEKLIASLHVHMMPLSASHLLQCLLAHTGGQRQVGSWLPGSDGADAVRLAAAACRVPSRHPPALAAVTAQASAAPHGMPAAQVATDSRGDLNDGFLAACLPEVTPPRAAHRAALHSNAFLASAGRKGEQKRAERRVLRHAAHPAAVPGGEVLALLRLAAELRAGQTAAGWRGADGSSVNEALSCLPYLCCCCCLGPCAPCCGPRR